jgi:hypothetical protein
MNVYFDCEFTKLITFIDPEPAELISIGCIADNGETFYAENETTISRPEIFSGFVIEVVVPLLEGGDYLMPYKKIAEKLKVWIEAFGEEVRLLSDAPAFDFQYVDHMFQVYGWPSNLNRQPKHISHARLSNNVDEIFRSQGYRRHHALDDAIVNKLAYEKVTKERRF